MTIGVWFRSLELDTKAWGLINISIFSSACLVEDDFDLEDIVYWTVMRHKQWGIVTKILK